jgi:hypothetical protein
MLSYYFLFIFVNFVTVIYIMLILSVVFFIFVSYNFYVLGQQIGFYIKIITHSVRPAYFGALNILLI